MIASFRDDETATVWSGRRSRRLPPDIQAVALRKLRLLNNAQRPGDLEQDRFGLKHLASIETWRPKRESCSIP